MSVRVEFRWPEEFVERVDAAAGDVPRSLWVRRAVEVALARADGSLRVAAEREVAEKFGLHPPAEQPVNPELQKQIALQRDAYELQRRRASPPSRPVAPRVPFRRDVKSFQRGDK